MDRRRSVQIGAAVAVPFLQQANAKVPAPRSKHGLLKVGMKHV